MKRLKRIYDWILDNGPLLLFFIGMAELMIGTITREPTASIFGGTMVITAWLWVICHLIETYGKR